MTRILRACLPFVCLLLLAIPLAAQVRTKAEVLNCLKGLGHGSYLFGQMGTWVHGEKPDMDHPSNWLKKTRDHTGILPAFGCLTWLQVDLYDRAARGPVLDDEPFYAACRRLLRAPGIAVFNLFGRRFVPSFERIAAAFDDRALVLPEADAGNRIVLALNGPPLALPWPVLYESAREVERHFSLPARKWVSGLREQAAGEAGLAV